jgi:putative ABC transport system permease protein
MALPALARLLLRLTDPRVREFLTGDLEESCIKDDDGALRRTGWSTRQAAAAVLQHPWRPGFRQRLRGDGFMRTFLQDLRYGARMVRRQPAFSAVVVMTLALAIGANTVIFSFANVLLLRPLPLRSPERLGWVFAVEPHRGGTRGAFSVPEFIDLRQNATAFESLAATSRSSVTLTERGDARRLSAYCASANLIDVWGLRLQIGRSFSPTADRPGSPREVVLSHQYWQNQRGANPAIVGQSLMLDGQPATVVGVLAPDIEIGDLGQIDVWVPLTLSPDAPREERRLRAIGRLKPGVTIAQASEEIRRLSDRIARDHPKTNEGWSARVAPTREAMTGADTWQVLAMLSLVVGLVLLLACANLANLMLARVTSRRRELAVRSALGASRTRVIRQMLTENLVYGLCGGAAGLLVAKGSLSLIYATSSDPFFAMVRIDANVLAFTAGLAVVTPLLFAVLPALHSTRADLNEGLKDGSRTASAARGARSRSVLIVAQLSLAVTLLVLATLFVQAMRNLTNAPLGIDAGRILTARVDLPSWKYTSDDAGADYFERLVARIRSSPAVEAVAVTDRLPFLDGEPITELTIGGQTPQRAQDRPWAVVAAVTEGYFPAIGVKTVAGRTFSVEDRPGRVRVAVINQEMARRHWSEPSRALGARLTLAGSAAVGTPVEVIGVVADVLRADRESANPQLYLSARQRPFRSAGLVLRAADPAAVAPDVRAAVRSLDADVPVYLLQPMQQALDEDLSSSRVLGGLLLAFGLLALVLAASGLYAVVSYSAAQRLKEIGVRVALGAVPADITRMMLKQAGILVAIGVSLGLVGGRVLAMGSSAILYKVSPADPRTYVGVAAILSAVALAASYVPVRRATSIDPVRALRLE